MEIMEIKTEHRDWLEANIGNYESAKNGYIRNLEFAELQMYEHIYRLYLDPNFLLSVWCGSCKYEMIMRLYKWYEQQPKSLPIENLEELKFVELKPIREQFDTMKNMVEKEIKKRGRKPKNNG
jgi:hypothetical protein